VTVSRKTVVIAVAGAMVVAAAACLTVDWRVVRLAAKRDGRCRMLEARRAVAEDDQRWRRIYDLSGDTEIPQRDPAGLELAQLPGGRRPFWIPRNNQLALAEVVAEEEEDVYGRGGHDVREGDTVLDCGANVGTFTEHAIEKGARLVVAIEPEPANVECLRRNFADAIAAGRVIVVPKGVWDKDDTLVLRVLPGQSGSGSVAMARPGASEEVRVPLTTIDELAAELKLQHVDFVKMDIEGAEKRALAGARATVARFRPRMAISLEHRPDDPEAIPALVARLWPELKSECGPCVWVKTAAVDRLAPEVLFAGPR
jgi:FkbM family methyltransferase